jgi:pyruvate kinase
MGAKVIVVYSESGNTARLIAKFRPAMPICVLTPSERVARQCFGLMKGCYAYVVDSLEDTHKLDKEVMRECRVANIASAGDPVVIVCGETFGTGATNQVKVEFIEIDPTESDAKAHLDNNNAEYNGCTIS